MHLFIFSFPSHQPLPFPQLLLSSLQESAGLRCICISLKGLFLFILCGWVFACMYMWVPYAYLVSVKAGKRHQVSWSWRYRHCELSNMGVKNKTLVICKNSEKSLQALLIFGVCVFVCHGTCAEVKGHLCRSQFSLPPVRILGTKFKTQTWQTDPLSPEPSHWSQIYFCSDWVIFHSHQSLHSFVSNVFTF